MALDGSIASQTAERVFLGGVVIAAILLMVRYRAFPPVRAAKGPAGIQVGGPWDLFRAEFREERDFVAPPAMRRSAIVIGVGFAILFLVLDGVY
jgi:hypothetical protein